MVQRTLLALALVAVACAPPINAKTQSVVDGWRSKLAPSTASFSAAGPSRPAFKIGQWAQYLETDKRGRPAQLTYKVVGVDSDATWLEIERVDYFGRSVTKILIKVDDWGDPNRVEIRKVIAQKDEEPAQEMPAFIQDMMAKPMLSGIAFKATEVAQEPVSVPAGTFKGALKVTTEVKTPFGIYHAATWAHAVVPIAGYVKSEDAEHHYKTELVAFGNSGATSSITGPVAPAMAMPH